MNFWEFVADFFTNVGVWLTSLLTGWGIPPFWTELILRTIGGFIIAAFPLAAVLLLIWVARKIVARVQDRLGPTSRGLVNAGPFAIFQSVADAIKILTKELIIPEGADRVTFVLAPILMVAASIAVWAVIPFGPSGMQGVDFNIGIFYILAISSVSLFSMLMAGWSSRNKYANLGAFRAASMIVSYEVPQMLALLAPVMLAGTLSMQGLIAKQAAFPYFIALPIPALVFFLAMNAEVGRLPFELAEADAEIVAGYQTEFSGMMFGAFYLAEFINNFAVSIIFAIIFCGGWQGPWVKEIPILGPVWLLAKSMIFFFILMFFWGTMPRMRIDQILSFNWKFLVPVSLGVLAAVALVDKFMLTAGVSPDSWFRAGILFLTNLVVGGITYGLLRWADRRSQRPEDVRRIIAVGK